MRILYFIWIVLLFFSCRQNSSTHLSKVTAKTVVLDSVIGSSKGIDSIIEPYKQKLAAKMGQPLSFAPFDFTKTDGDLQSTLGNLVADLCFEMADSIYQKKTKENIDFVLLNHGGLRAAIPKGTVTTESAFNLMPFENDLVVAQIKGEKVAAMVNYFMKNQRAHPLSKNVNLIFSADDYSLKINDEPFDITKSYAVLTNDFLQNGGDRMNFFTQPEKLTPLNYKVRDAIIDYFKKTDTLKATLDNRAIKRP